MKAQFPFRKTLLAGLTAVMVIGGASSAFADGRGKGHGKDDDDNHDRGNRGKIEFHMDFKDMVGGDVEWARENIARLAFKRVFDGYDDGTFQPRKPVSRIEAITAAVRLLGLRDQAESAAEMSTQLHFQDAKEIEKNYPWAVGYVAVAVENGLFADNATKVNPEEPADRLWATELLVKALKLEGEARTKMNEPLPFKDAKNIPAGAVGYVAVAVEKKLIEGYEDGTFRPFLPVTRAELAALLDRTSEQMPEDNNVVKGKLAAAVTNNVLTLTVNGGQSKSLVLDPNAFIFRNGLKIAASQLLVGDELKVRMYNDVVLFVEVTKLGQPEQQVTFVDGTLIGTTPNAQGKISAVAINQATAGGQVAMSYNADANITIAGDVTKLVPNQPVQLKLINNLVTTITIK